jgi:antitoxin (DNA-binding transcriptional repressor) of toxin-antitoxin stability system
MNSSISTIKMRYFRENSQEIIDAVKAGKSFLVMRRSKPVLKITAPDVDEWGDEGDWVSMGFREVFPDGIPAKEFFKKLEKTIKDEKNGR